MDLVKNVEDITQFLGELKSPVPEDLIPGMKPPKHDFSVGQVIQGLAKRWSPGCVNSAGKARQKWQATAGTEFTNPGRSQAL